MSLVQLHDSADSVDSAEINHGLDYFEELQDLVKSVEFNSSIAKLKSLNEVLHYILIEEGILEDSDGSKMLTLEHINNMSTTGLAERCERYGRLKNYDMGVLLSMFRTSVIFLKMVGVTVN